MITEAISRPAVLTRLGHILSEEAGGVEYWRVVAEVVELVAMLGKGSSKVSEVLLSEGILAAVLALRPGVVSARVRLWAC